MPIFSQGIQMMLILLCVDLYCQGQTHINTCTHTHVTEFQEGEAMDYMYVRIAVYTCGWL